MPPNSRDFETARTRKFRSSELSKEDERTIGNIEQFGCSVVSVKRTNYGLGWSYTIGIFDTSGKPEIVTVGLQPETALMGWAIWYYDDADFPVVQAVYPDLENRFPEDEGFDRAFEQPRMQPTAPMTRVEDDFWASADPKSSLFNWKFTDPPHAHAYLSETINNGTEHVTYVSHDAEDGAWQFLGDSMSDGGGPVVVCLHYLIDRDESLAELADLPLGWYAERSKLGEPWVRRKHTPDDGTD